MSMSNLDAFKTIKEKFNSSSVKTEEVFDSKHKETPVVLNSPENPEVSKTPENPEIPEQKKSDTEAKKEKLSDQVSQINDFIDEAYSKYEDIIQDINVKHIDTLENDDPLFKFKIVIRDKTIEFRKWKVKDRKNLLQASNDVERRKALVYNCIKDQNIALDNEEFNFVLEKIRSVSVKLKSFKSFNGTFISGATTILSTFDISLPSLGNTKSPSFKSSLYALYPICICSLMYLS